MQINTLVLGAYENNCYILRKDNSADCLIIDTGLDNDPLLEYLEQNNLNPLALVLTHGHGDHIAGVEFLREAYKNIKVYIHKADAEMLASAVKNCSAMVGERIESKPADILIEKEGRMDFAGFKFDVLHTPGHTPGGICLYSSENKTIFTGDTLFANSVGRTDFPSYDAHKCMQQLIENIQKKILVLPDDTKVLPGHGPASIIRMEKKHNPYLN
ncbi:MAG: MBL fold metallo-hydrolase [Planctomycetaceae bacterium]|nr:MBL fold metallo-hydrolase [Planctomycetaceae bacterium]